MKKLPIFIFLLCFHSATPRIFLTTKEKIEEVVVNISVLDIEAQRSNRSISESLYELQKLEEKLKK